MSQNIVRCTFCGLKHDFIETTSSITCQACGNVFFIEDGVFLNSKSQNEIEVLKKLRIRLDEMVRVNDAKMIHSHSKEILTILPDDILAKYYFSYASYELHQPKFLNHFFKTKINATSTHINQICDHMMNYVDIREYSDITKYIDMNCPTYSNKAKEIIDARIEIEEQYSEIKRDIFICHRSVDLEIVLEVVSELEQDGYTCWYSKRNLRPDDNENYIKNIETAIENASVFLIITSKSAMLSKDVQRELVYANKINKTKLEYKIDDSKHISLFKQSFDGIKWIDASKEKQYIQLKKRMADLFQRFTLNEPIHYESINDFDVEKNSYTPEEIEAPKRKIEIKKLKTLTKKEKVIKSLQVKPLKTIDDQLEKVSDIEEKILESGNLFLENQIFDVAKINFKKIYTKNTTNVTLLFGLILCELKVSKKIFDNFQEPVDMFYSKELESYLDHLINILTDSDEHRQIINQLEILLRLSVVNISENENLVKIFLVLFSTLVKVKELVQMIHIFREFDHEVRALSVKFNMTTLKNLYYTLRDVLLNYNPDDLGIYLYNLVLNHSSDHFKNYLDIIEDALDYTPGDVHLNKIKFFSLMKSTSLEEAIFKTIHTSKFKSIDHYLANLKLPEVEIKNILRLLRTNTEFITKLPIIKIDKFHSHLTQYLPNFSLNLYVEQQTKYGFFLLKYKHFKNAYKVFSIVLKTQQNEMSLWGLILAKSKCQDEYQMFRNKIELIHLKEYNYLLNIAKDIEFYNQLYLAIKKDTMSLELKDSISKRWQEIS